MSRKWISSFAAQKPPVPHENFTRVRPGTIPGTLCEIKQISTPFPNGSDLAHLDLVMSRLAAFFQGEDTHLGLFYPTHYLIAIFPGLYEAETAAHKLRGLGFSDREVIAVPGQDLTDLVLEEEVHGGIFGYLMKEFSRFLHTEAAYTDLDLQEAREGAAVLAVHCPDDRSKQSVWSEVSPGRPVAARYYTAGGIEHLAGET